MKVSQDGSATIMLMVAVFAYCSSPTIANNNVSSSDLSKFRDVVGSSKAIDHLAQEQRLAVQIITTDSGATSDQVNDSMGPKINQHQSGNGKLNDAEHDGSTSFENQLKLMESQLSRTRHIEQNDSDLSNTSSGNHQQALMPKRIVINLNTLNSNSSDASGGPTKLTIGFAPSSSNENDDLTSGFRGKLGSDRSKTIVLPEARVRPAARSGSEPVRLAGQPEGRGAMRGAIMDGISRQGGVPTFVMSAHEMGQQNAEPQMRFMLNSEEVDRQRQQQTGGRGRSQFDAREPARLSQSATARNLREELDNLAGEIESVERKLGGYAMAGGDQEGPYVPFDMPVEDRSGRILLSSSARRLFNGDQTGPSRMNRDARSLAVKNPLPARGYLPPDGDSDIAERMTSVSNFRSSPSRVLQDSRLTASANGRDDARMMMMGPISYGNQERREQTSPGKSAALGNLFISLESSHNGRRGDMHESNALNFNEQGGQEENKPATNNDDENNRRHNYYYGRGEERKLETQESASENFGTNSRNVVDGRARQMWRQRDSTGPLSVDNSNLFAGFSSSYQEGRKIVRGGTGNDIDGKFNRMSASVAAPNPAREMLAPTPARSEQHNSSGHNLMAKQLAASSNNAPFADATNMNDRVARMLDRLRLYTTKEQLIKVARDLQRMPPPRDLADRSLPDRELPPGMADILQARDVGQQQESPVMSFDETGGRKQVELSALRVSPDSTLNSWPPTNRQDVRMDAAFRSDQQQQQQQYKRSIQRQQVVRNQVPGPINYNPIDTLLAMATSSNEQEQAPESNSEPGQQVMEEEEAPSRADDDDPSESSQEERKPDDGSGTRLLNEFKERQSKLRTLQDASSRDASLDSNEQEVESTLASPTVPPGYTITDNAVHDYETTSSAANQINDQPELKDSKNGHNRRGLQQEGAKVGPVNQINEELNDYGSNRDLIEVFKNNEKLYSSDSEGAELPGGLTSSTNIKAQRFMPDGRRIIFNNGVDDNDGQHDTDSKYNDDDGDEDSSDGMHIAPSEKEEEEIRALEQVIDELVEREKKEKKQRESEKK